MFSFIDRIPLKNKIKNLWGHVKFPLTMAGLCFIISAPILMFIAKNWRAAAECGAIVSFMIFMISLSEQISCGKREF